MPSAEPRPRRHPHLSVRFAEPSGLVADCPGRGGKTLALSHQAFQVLELCDGTRTVPEIAAALPWGTLSAAGRTLVLRQVLTQLDGLLFHGDDDGELSPYYASYEQASAHRSFVTDPVRTGAYREAIAALIQPGDVVMDVGAGTGVLSFFASRAGASVVHAVEPTAMIEVAKELAVANGVENVVFHRSEAQGLSLDVQAQLLICDWIGSFVFHERIFPALAHARDRFLAPGGKILPGAVSLWLVPFEDPKARAAGPEAWCAFDGLDLSLLREREYARSWSESRRLTPEQLLAAPAQLGRFDATTLDPAQLLSWDGEAILSAERSGVIDGFCGFFVAEYAPGIELNTGPLAPLTFYQHHVFPTPPLAVEAGATISCAVDVRATELGWPVTTLRGRVAAESFEHRYDEGP